MRTSLAALGAAPVLAPAATPAAVGPLVALTPSGAGSDGLASYLPAVQVKRIGYVGVRTEEPERTTWFFRDVLGLEEAYVDLEAAGLEVVGDVVRAAVAFDNPPYGD